MIKKLFSMFGKKEAEPVVVAKKKSPQKNTNALKKEINSLKKTSDQLSEEINEIKSQVVGIPDHNATINEFHVRHEAHEKAIDKFNLKHEGHEKAIALHSEKFSHFDSKLQDHRIDIVEIKSRLNELSQSISKFEPLFAKIEEIEKRANEMETVKIASMNNKIAKAKAPVGSLIEQYHSLAPSTRKILGLLLNMHVGHKGKWIALSDLRNLVYPAGENSNSTQAAMAKAIRPLYENGFVEKKRDKSFVYVSATKKGRDAAKEAGLHKQAEKFDAVFAELEN